MPGPATDSQFLPALLQTLRAKREEAGIPIRRMELAMGAGEDEPRERTSFYRFEKRGEIPAEELYEAKYWPNVDRYVTAYAVALGVEAYDLWAEALRNWRRARPVAEPRAAARRAAARAAGRSASPRQSRPPVRPSKRQGRG